MRFGCGNGLNSANIARGTKRVLRDTTRRLFAFLGSAAVFTFMAYSAPPAEAQTETAENGDLKLREFVRLVLQHNESLQSKLIDAEIGRKKHKGEQGIFEPEFVGSIERDLNKRRNTAEQTTSLGSPVFFETNTVYNSGIEALVPTGARVRLGYTLRDLGNNLQGIRGFTNGEYQTFVGVSLTQPLLKGGGIGATMASIRAAALGSEVAFQEYRRQLMLIVSTAEAAYWNLYMAQEQVRFFEESVAVAETVLRDTQSKLDAGKGSDLEVLEAQAGLALRRSKRNEARQKHQEAISQVASLFSSSPIASTRGFKAAERPTLADLPISFFDSWQSAFDANPDYLAQRKKMQLENIRLAYAENQRLPQFDLKASYGLNGLAQTPSLSWRDAESQNFPSWSIGFEMRVPLGGGRKSKNELDAAKLTVQKALLSLKELETQIANSLHTSLEKVRNRRESVSNYNSVVAFNQNLLDTQLKRLEVGKVESRKVLEVEADLLEAKNNVVDALVQYRRALLEKELVEGSLLKNRHLDLTQHDLEFRLDPITRKGELSEADYRQFVAAGSPDYEWNSKLATMSPAERQKFLDEQLRAAEARLNGPQPAPAPEPVGPVSDDERNRRALQELKRMIEELKKQ